AVPAFAAGSQASTPTRAELPARAGADEWRTPDPHNLLVMQLAAGPVLIELAPDFAPLHAADTRTLVHEHDLDGLPVNGVQENCVAQWDDPESTRDRPDPAMLNPRGTAKKTLPRECTRTVDDKLPWTPLPDGDVYAPQVGFVEGFPAAR